MISRPEKEVLVARDEVEVEVAGCRRAGIGAASLGAAGNAGAACSAAPHVQWPITWFCKGGVHWPPLGRLVLVTPTPKAIQSLLLGASFGGCAPL